MSGVVGQVCLPVEMFSNPRLSYTAIGILAASLSLPSGVSASYKNLIGHGSGEKSVRNALRLLEAEGLRWRCMTANSERKPTWIVLVYPTRPCLEQVIADVRKASGNPTSSITIMGGPENEIGKKL